MKGNRKMCLDAGANDCSTKPVRTTEVLGTDLDSVDLASHAKNLLLSKAEPPLSPAWDMAAALALVEGDRNLMGELAHLFAEECPRAMEEIRHALDTNNAALLERVAHTMKGSSASIAATAASLAALALESEARSGDLAKTREQFGLLQKEIGRLLPELEAFSP